MVAALCGGCGGADQGSRLSAARATARDSSPLGRGPGRAGSGARFLNDLATGGCGGGDAFRRTASVAAPPSVRTARLAMEAAAAAVAGSEGLASGYGGTFAAAAAALPRWGTGRTEGGGEDGGRPGSSSARFRFFERKVARFALRRVKICSVAVGTCVHCGICVRACL